MRAFIFCLTIFASPLSAGEDWPELLYDYPFLGPIIKVQSFDCSQKTCSQIRSCEEACYKLRVCGHTRRDGDGDGIPCENLCSRRC